MLAVQTLAERGLAKFDWWKDWRGECVAIVASGPSTSKTVVESLRNRIHVIAIKKNVELCPWADAVYGCDAAWWRSVHGLPDYKGLKLSWVNGGCKHYRDIGRIEIAEKTHKLLLDEPGLVGSGGNSGFQVVNLVAQFGVTGILGIGFDLLGNHWYGRNAWPMANNPDSSNFQRWKSAFDNAAADLKAMGIEFINTSSKSALSCFEHKSVEQALADWGL